MLAQRLRHRVDIERLAVTRGDGGAKVESFATHIADEPAEVYGLSGAEFARASSEYGRVTHRITVRRQDVLPTDRITHEGVIYNIRAVLPDFKMRQWLTLMCESGVNDG